MIVLPQEVASAPMVHLPPGISLDTNLLSVGMPLSELGATTKKLESLKMRTPRNFLEREEPLLRAVQFGRVSWARVLESLGAAGFQLKDFPCLISLTRYQKYMKRA